MKEFSKNLTRQGFILPASKIQHTIQTCNDKLYAIAKIVNYFSLQYIFIFPPSKLRKIYNRGKFSIE